MVRAHASLLVFASLLLSVPVRAQESAAKPDPAPKLALLNKAIDKMAALRSCAFSAKPAGTRAGAAAGPGMVAFLRAAPAAPAQPAAPARAPAPAQPAAPPQPPAADAGVAWRAVAAAPIAMAGSTAASPATGAWSDGLLWLGSGDRESVWHGRRMIARQGRDAWRLRQGVSADGQPAPRTFDPETFFPALANAKLELLQSEVGDLDDKPVEILTLHAAGDDAVELLWAGLLPDAPRVGSMRPRPEVELDIAVWLDPASARICQVKLRCYTKGSSNPMVAGFAAGHPLAPVVLRLPQAEQAQDAQDQPEDNRAKVGLAIKKGLPERNSTDSHQVVVVGWDIEFTSHDSAKVPELDARARTLLGLVPGK